MARHTLQKSFIPVMEDAMRRVVRRERQEVLAAAKRELRGKADFDQWLEEFYSDTTYTENQMRPVLESLVQALGPEMMREVGEEWVYNDALRAWVADYLTRFATYYQNKSRDEIRSLVNAALAEGAIEVVEERVDEWIDGGPSGTTRSRKQSEKEITRFGGAVALIVFGAAGIKKMRWKTIGENCEFCNQLNGNTVSTGVPFMTNGDILEAEGKAPLAPKRDIKHPPIHAGCDCILVPVI